MSCKKINYYLLLHLNLENIHLLEDPMMVPYMKDHIKKEQMNPNISCNALEGITTPQTLKIEGHIKNKKVIVLIDSCNTHNFIHFKIAKELNFFLYPTPKCQVMLQMEEL